MIELLVGMIASGKSTYAKRRANDGWVIINADAIVTAIHGGEYALYNDNFKPIYKAVENQIATVAMAMGKNIVIDRTCLSKQSRALWIGFAKLFNTPIVAVEFPVSSPDSHGERRFKSDPRSLSLETWIQVAVRHALSYEKPTIDEGFQAVVPGAWKP